MVENGIKNDSKSIILLITAILLAIAVFLWVILSFDDQPGEKDGIGQSKFQKILVVSSPEYIIRDYHTGGRNI